MIDDGMNAGHSRRTFIKGVIAAGATVSASAYLFRTTILGQNDSSLPGSVERLITLEVNGQQRRVDVLKLKFRPAEMEEPQGGISTSVKLYPLPSEPRQSGPPGFVKLQC